MWAASLCQACSAVGIFPKNSRNLGFFFGRDPRASMLARGSSQESCVSSRRPGKVSREHPLNDSWSGLTSSPPSPIRRTRSPVGTPMELVRHALPSSPLSDGGRDSRLIGPICVFTNLWARADAIRLSTAVNQECVSHLLRN